MGKMNVLAEKRAVFVYVGYLGMGFIAALGVVGLVFSPLIAAKGVNVVCSAASGTMVRHKTLDERVTRTTVTYKYRRRHTCDTKYCHKIHRVSFV